MRILVVGAIQGGSIPIGQSICRGFLRQKQVAEWLDFSDLLPEYVRLLASKNPDGTRKFLSGLKRRLLEETLRFRPEVIFGIAQRPIMTAEVLKTLKQAGIRLCFWFVEDFSVFSYWKELAPRYDQFFVIQQEPFFGHLKALGCRNVHYLPLAFDDDADGATGQEEQAIPISFVGAPYPNRVKFLSEIAGPDFQIFGEAWNHFPNPSVAFGGRRLTENECRGIYLRSKVNLNLHSSENADGFGQGDFVNPRTFEIAGLGQFQIVDQRRLLPLHFDPVKEVPSFATWSAFKDAMRYFLNHEEERKAIAANARRRVMAAHTYAHRAREILDILE
jgi:spore maturation protein CgeB